MLAFVPLRSLTLTTIEMRVNLGPYGVHELKTEATTEVTTEVTNVTELTIKGDECYVLAKRFKNGRRCVEILGVLLDARYTNFKNVREWTHNNFNPKTYQNSWEASKLGAYTLEDVLALLKGAKILGLGDLHEALLYVSVLKMTNATPYAVMDLAGKADGGKLVAPTVQLNLAEQAMRL